MVADPAATPVTTPVPLTTVATEVRPLVHDPPPVASDNVVAAPAQTEAVPVMEPAFGNGFTVTVVVT